MIYGARIKQARELLGEGQTEFGRHVGLPQSKVSRAEGGLYIVGEEVLVQLAEHSGFPPEFFERPQRPAVDEYQFRARVRVKAADRKRSIASAEVVHEAFELMRQQTSNPAVNVPSLGLTPAAAAAEMRSVFGLDPRSPIQNLSLTLERFGAVLLSLPIPGTKHDAFSWWHSDDKRRYPVIATLAGVPGDRLRWNLAHELGHLVMHEGGVNVSDGELEADIFAAHFLTPIDGIRPEMPGKPTLSSLYAMKGRWGVSVQSLIRRARDLGRLDGDQYMSLFRQISARGERMNERFPVEREKARGFRKMAEVLYGPNPAEGLAGLSAWTTGYAEKVLAEYAGPHELPGRRVTAPKTELADVVPLRRPRIARR